MDQTETKQHAEQTEGERHVAAFTAGESMDPTDEQMAAAKLEQDRLAWYDTSTLESATQLAEEVQAAKDETLRLKGEHDSQKKIWTGLAEELGQYMLTRKAQRHARPVRQMTIDEVISETDHAAGPADPQSDDLWKGVPIAALEQFGLNPKDIEHLLGGALKAGGTHPVTTLGELVLFATPYPGNPSFTRTIGDIKGLGQAAVDRLATANEKFWAAWGSHLEAELKSGEHADKVFWAAWKTFYANTVATPKPEAAHADPRQPGTAGQDSGDVVPGVPAADLHRLADDGGIPCPEPAAEPVVAAAPAGEEGPFFNKFASKPAGSTERDEWGFESGPG